VEIFSRANNDTITIGSGNLDLLPYAVTVDGGTGTDTMTVNDQVAAFSDTYTVTSTMLTRVVFGGLTYGTVEGMTLNAEAGSNTININSTAAGVPVTVNAGAGNDTVNVGSGNLDLLRGAVTVNGQAGTDRVNVNDQNLAFNDTYSITNTTVTRPIFGGLTYGTIEFLTINAQTGKNVFNIFGTPATVSTTINGNGGGDTFNILGPVGPLTINP
jgi:hypothetical protein